METLKPNTSIRGRAALFATACLVVPILAGETWSSGGLAESELSRRSVAIQEAQELLRKGDQAYTAGNYGDAAEAYAGARSLIPDAPVSAELRKATTERYAQASVEYARQLVRGGDLAGAKETVDKVLVKAVAPDHPGALAFRAQLDDPIRTNPGLTQEHAKDMDEVRRLLYTADGAYNLGQFDKAKTSYEGVIRIDPYNTAARRGMERLSATKSGYYRSAYDQTRSEMLAEVDKQWELPVPEIDVEPFLGSSGATDLNGDMMLVRDKIERIIIPKFAVEQASLPEAIDLLRIRSAENDTFELESTRKGVNITINLGPRDSPEAKAVLDARFDLQLSNVPVDQILKYLTDITRTSYSTDDFSVNIVPLGSSSLELVTRTYRVPPDFISSISSSAAAESDDPFGEPAAGGGLLATRMGAQEALAQQGVTFPEGASASYTPASNMLRVVNTEKNHAFISQIVETMARSEPVIVKVHVTMIKVQQDRLEELGFDWLLDNFGFGGQSFIPGADKLNLSGGSVGNGRPLDDIPLPVDVLARRPITSGNRSGDFATGNNTIDSLILSSGGRQAQNSAPGVLAVRGQIDNGTVIALMRGLDQKKGVDVMARPSSVTRSGQSTSISIVREFIYPTEYEPPELPNSTGGNFGGGGATPVTPATPTAFDVRNVGIELEVLPVVDDSKQFVNVTLNPVFTEFDGFVNYGSPINTTQQGLFSVETVEVTENAILEPVFSVRRLNTNVDILDGATMVIGGLIQDNVQIVDDSVPILGSIPIVGRLFQSNATKKTSTATIFLVGVEVMDPTGRPFRNR